MWDVLVYRDRERGVARYNEFRRNLLMIPISKWEDLTDDEKVVEALCEVYGDDVEKLDLLVGLHAEKKIKGFAISETAFFIFLLIASRYIQWPFSWKMRFKQLLLVFIFSMFSVYLLWCSGGWKQTGFSLPTSTLKPTQGVA